MNKEILDPLQQKLKVRPKLQYKDNKLIDAMAKEYKLQLDSFMKNFQRLNDMSSEQLIKLLHKNKFVFTAQEISHDTIYNKTEAGKIKTYNKNANNIEQLVTYDLVIHCDDDLEKIHEVVFYKPLDFQYLHYFNLL